MSDYPSSRILLATEHTEFDTGAERIALAIAKKTGQPLRVVFPMLSNPEYEAEMPEYALRAEQAVAEKIEHLRRQAESMGVQLDVRVRRGSHRHEEIVAEAKDINADFIIIRRRGKPGFFSRMLVGDMVSRVIHDAACSVLLVRRKAKLWDTGILAAVGDTPNAPVVAKAAAGMAREFGLLLSVLSVAPDKESLPRTQSINTLNVALASGGSVNARGEVRVGKLVEQTVTAVKETGADLLVIGRQRYHLRPFGGQSLMQDIAGNVDVPTLVVPV